MSIFTLSRTIIAGAALFALALPPAAVMLSSSRVLAAGSGTTSQPADPCAGKTGNDLTKCRKKHPLPQNMDDEAIYYYAVSMAKDEGNFQGALDLLKTAKNQNDPRILTYIGYTMRKLGDVDGGMAFYAKALAIDPNSTNTREYLGEAYLQKGDLANAKDQLAEIQSRCGNTCENYSELAKQISDYEATHQNG